MKPCSLFIAAAVAVLAGCAPGGGTPSGGNPAVYSAARALTVADQAALVYVSLPRCTGSNGPACSDPVVVARIKQAAAVAFAAVKTAEAGGDYAAALAAVTTLVALIPMH